MIRDRDYFGEGGECLICGMLAPRLIYTHGATIQTPICEICQAMISEQVERKHQEIKARFPDKPKRRRRRLRPIRSWTKSSAKFRSRDRRFPKPAAAR